MNKKKLLSFAMCVCILLSCLFLTDMLPAAIGKTSVIYESAAPVTPPESDFTYRKSPISNPTKVAITKYTGKETKVVIPEKLDGLPVASIASGAFEGNEKLTYVKLPSTLIAISGKAFTLCSSLTSFDIDPDNTTFSVIDGVLYRKGTGSASSEIKTLAAFPAGKGGHFTIPYGIETIGAYAFDHCYNLTSVDMYNTVTSISAHAFSYCWNLENIRLSDNLKILGTEALAHCDSLTKIDLPASLNNIGTDAVLGTIDSDNNKVYYFIDGISCAKNSYAYKYLIDQALPKSIITLNNRTVTHNDTGIKLIDAYGILPKDASVDIVVEEVPLSKVKKYFPTRYSSALAYDISFTKNGEKFRPNGNVILSFDSVCPDAIPSATKIYQKKDDSIVLTSGSAHAPFIGAQISRGGRFIILMNDDFSLKGDVDGDGVVTLFDVKATLYASTKNLILTPEQTLAANVDNSSNGKITTKDARIILRLAGGMSDD